MPPVAMPPNIYLAAAVACWDVPEGRLRPAAVRSVLPYTAKPPTSQCMEPGAPQQSHHDYPGRELCHAMFRVLVTFPAVQDCSEHLKLQERKPAMQSLGTGGRTGRHRGRCEDMHMAHSDADVLRAAPCGGGLLAATTES